MMIMNNLPALTAFTAFNSTNKSLQKTIHSLSTGLRINSASDDAAGFAVSEKMRSQICGLDTALRNSQDGISLLQTAEGALEQTNAMLQRMRDLSIQAGNDSLTSNDRQYIQLEIEQLKDEIDRIAAKTQFNKKRILDGSSGALWASSDPGVKVRVNGGLTRTDNFGQKVSAEGNYRIEVIASPGQAQVQKSNIMNVMDITTKTGTTEKDYVIDLSKSLDNSENPASSGDGWEFTTDDDGNKYLRIFADGTFNLTGTAPAGMYIDVEGTASNAVVFLSDVSIDNSGEGLPAFYIEEGAKVDIYLSGNNTLKSGEYYAGICVLPGAELTISSSSGDFSTSGTLNVTGGSGGAGIGGSSIADENDIGTITINGGTIVAEGGESVAGIGCSYDGRNGNIIINGGSITAQGGSFTDENPRLLPSGQIKFYVRAGAGIGSGSRTDDSNNSINNMNITITGGTVNAYGGTSDAEHNGTEYKIGAAGIGGGTVIDSGHIKIGPGANVSASAGNTTANARSATGAPESEQIGYGWRGNTATRDVDEPNAPVYPPQAREIPEKPKITSEDTLPNTYRTLDDISQFYDSSGVFLVSKPKTITVTQGNGQSANITLYATDTIYDVSRKINDAIAVLLGHGQYTDNPGKFCTLSDGTPGTSESVAACESDKEAVYDEDLQFTGFTYQDSMYRTLVIRSGIPGKSGELLFSGDEEILRALGLNTIRESSETKFTASIYDAHSGAVITSGAKVTGNVIHDALTGVDIEFSDMAGIKSSWDENSKRFILTGGEKYSAVIHLKDNGITFHTGANMGEDFSIQLGDMSCSALGISRVNLATRESASRSIGIIDRAISRVSSQRAKIGAYINGLEHTMSSLTITSANLTEAESRIRDTDMAQTMMDFVKLQILKQSGTSMLAQANQIPRSVLSLFGN